MHINSHFARDIVVYLNDDYQFAVIVTLNGQNQRNDNNIEHLQFMKSGKQTMKFLQAKRRLGFNL